MKNQYHLNPLPAEITELIDAIADGDSEVARYLAEFGTPEVVDGTITALSHPRWRMRSGALLGIKNAITKNRATAAFKTRLAAPVAQLWAHSFLRGQPLPDGFDQASWDIADALRSLDRDRVVASLRDPAILRQDHPHLDKILSVLNGFAAPVIGVDLLSWLAALRPTAVTDTHPDPYPYGEILCNLGIQHHPDLPSLVADVEDNFPYYSGVQSSAAEAMCYFNGLPPGFEIRILDIYLELEAEQRKHLPQAAHYLAAAMEMDANCSAGIEQFIEEIGENYDFVMSYLTAVGNHSLIWKIQSILELFTPQGKLRPGRKLPPHLEEPDMYHYIIDLEYPEHIKSRELKVLYYQFAAKHAKELNEFLQAQ